jgi:hypothetical protein
MKEARLFTLFQRLAKWYLAPKLALKLKIFACVMATTILIVKFQALVE